MQLLNELKRELFVRILYNGIVNALNLENQPQKLNLSQKDPSITQCAHS